MTTPKPNRLATVPTGQLNLASQRGQREFRRRMARTAADYGNSWIRMTRKPVNHPPALRNNLGHAPRWRWVAKE